MPVYFAALNSVEFLTMRNFLKNNLLAIIVCLTVAFTYASATTITRPYSASDYAGGTKAVGAKVNAEFANIVAWLNGGNIGSDNIATSGVATANIASFAVTNPKLGYQSVTLDKLYPSSISVTASSASYSTTSEVPAVVTGLSTTFVASGRPVKVSLETNPSTFSTGTYGGFLSGGNIVTGDGNDAIFFVRDSSTTAFLRFAPINVGGGLFARPVHPCSAFAYTETSLVQGNTYTFALKASTGTTGASSTVSVTNCRLVVREW